MTCLQVQLGKQLALKDASVTESERSLRGRHLRVLQGEELTFNCACVGTMRAHGHVVGQRMMREAACRCCRARS